MEPENPPRVLEYRRVRSADGEAPFRWADGILLGVFVVYAAANYVLVIRSFPPWDAFLAFAIPLPLMFVLLAALVHFLASPPLFNRWVLVLVILLVIITAVIDMSVFAEALAGV